jgi:hypothetical protein
LAGNNQAKGADQRSLGVAAIASYHITGKERHGYEGCRQAEDNQTRQKISFHL